MTKNYNNYSNTEKLAMIAAEVEYLADNGAGNSSSTSEPFRVKEWTAPNLDMVIPTCTTDIDNASIDKVIYTITGQEATDFQIVGMAAYQLSDASGKRINAWPVCQFTGQNQTELHVRFMCGGTQNKTAKRLSAWVLLKHR